jgi:glycosyltransferase involved in cell wall biosynthesis
MVAFVWDPISYILSRAYLNPDSKWKLFVFRIPLAIGRLIDRWICRNSNAILTGSSYHISRLQDLASSPENVTVVLPGAHIRPSVRAERQRYVILATAWKEGKDPQYVLDLVSQIQHSEFLVAGAWISQAMKERFLKQLKRLQLQDRVTITGALGEDGLLDLYSQALAFLQIKADVGFGLPALEAAGQGCTFIIPSGQGVCDIFMSGRDGFIVSEKDTRQIVEHLQQLYDNPTTAVQMGKNAWSKAQSYSWKKHAEALVRIMKRFNGSSL